jgi:cellulose synthase (UDP-forming)
METFLYWSATHMFRILCIIIPAAFLLFGLQAVYAHLPYAIGYLFPYLAAEMAVMTWLTQGRILPLMADLSQMLVANDIAKSVIVGLFKPKGHKFEVTAKGGDRETQFVQWPMLRVFLGFLALNVGGVLWAFVIDPNQRLTDASSIALYWSWYNIILLVLACFVCIEAPQLRFGDRFRSDGKATLTIGGVPIEFPVMDISIGGMRLRGAMPGAHGTPVHVSFDGLDVEAELVRAYDDSFGIEFVQSKEARLRLIRHVYGGKYGGKLPHIKPREVATAMINRVFR